MFLNCDPDDNNNDKSRRPDDMMTKRKYKVTYMTDETARTFLTTG